MSSLQERLQLKRVPLDTWNTREQLCLASAVVRSGDQNWMSVSRAFKIVGEPNRPPDWYSQKSCAAQYGALLEHVETPKRKKRSSEGAVETPQESILKRLTQERILEIQKNITELNQQYEQLQNEIAEVNNPTTSEERLQEMWAEIEAAKRARERENARRAALLKEREERRARAERTWRPPQQQGSPSPGSPVQPPSSPLLTSLLKSSPVVTTPQHIMHPANVVDTVSPSAGAPTLSMLLEKPQSGTSPHESKHAAIEHIKSQLVQIEQQLKANNPSPTPVPLTPTATAPAVDIDDIEIKAEDVYAFRDIDIHIPPVTAMHKSAARIEKPVFKKEEEESPEIVNTIVPINEVDVKIEPNSTDSAAEDVLEADMETNEDETVEEEQQGKETREQTPEVEVKIAFPEVKFPTPEIKVIHPEDHKVREEIKEPEVPLPPEPEKEVEEAPQEMIQLEETQALVKEESIEPELEQDVVVKEEVNTEEVNTEEETQAAKEDENELEQTEEIPEVTRPEEIPLPPAINIVPQEIPAIPEIPLPEETEAPPPEQKEAEVIVKEEKEEFVQPDENRQNETEVTRVDEKLLEDFKRDEDAEDSIPLKMMREGALAIPAPVEAEPEAVPDTAAVKIERPLDTEDTHTETDDDTPMELSREEEKDGKKKRDYSRKKKSESRTCSGSESAAEVSAPESPSASDTERQHRLWKKSVMLVYSRLCAHKYASLFLRPISDEEAPGYSIVVKRPMDLTTIRRNIDSGLVRTTAEFQRDVLLMLSNALMYNSSEHSVYTMARELHEEAQCQLGMLLAAQAHAGLVAAPPRRKRRAPFAATRHSRVSDAVHPPKRHHH